MKIFLKRNFTLILSVLAKGRRAPPFRAAFFGPRYAGMSLTTVATAAPASADMWVLCGTQRPDFAAVIYNNEDDQKIFNDRVRNIGRSRFRSFFVRPGFKDSLH